MLAFSRRFLILGIIALVASTAQATAAEINKFLPDDSEIVLVLNVKQLLDAPLIKNHALPTVKTLVESNPDIKNILAALGFDPLKDLSSITLASSGISADAKGILIATGTFDVAKFEAQAEKVAKDKDGMLKILKEGDHKILEISGPMQPKPAFAAMIDGTSIVASTEKSVVLEAYDRASGKKKGAIKKDLASLIEKMSPDQSLWVAAPGSVFAKAPIDDEKTKKTVESIDNITLGLTVSKDISMVLAIAAKNADAAKDMAEQMKQGLEQAKGMLALLAGNQKELAPIVDVVGSMKVATEGTRVTLKSEVSHETIEKNLKKD